MCTVTAARLADGKRWAYTDGPLAKEAGSATYKVCEAGTSTCSALFRKLVKNLDDFKAGQKMVPAFFVCFFDNHDSKVNSYRRVVVKAVNCCRCWQVLEMRTSCLRFRLSSSNRTLRIEITDKKCPSYGPGGDMTRNTEWCDLR